MQESILVKQLSQKTNISIEDLEDMFAELSNIVMANLLKGECVRIPNLGSFLLQFHPDLSQGHFATHDTKITPSRRIIEFTASENLKFHKPFAEA